MIGLLVQGEDHEEKKASARNIW